jgi:hypothetical protein
LVVALITVSAFSIHSKLQKNDQCNQQKNYFLKKSLNPFPKTPTPNRAA